MRRIVMLVVLLSVVIGCKSTVGPFQNTKRPDKVDDPLFNIPEQERRGRERLSLPADDPSIAPRTGIDRYGPNSPTYSQ